jgi:hypothetical protein
VTDDNHNKDCPTCAGTGSIDFIPHWFIADNGTIVPKRLLPDGTYIDLTLDDEPMK